MKCVKPTIIKELVCTECPRSCLLKVSLCKENNSVKGNNCKRGETYALYEIATPKRYLTTTAKTLSKAVPLLPVKTSIKINKDLIFECAQVISKITVKLPIKIGDVLIHNILDTGADIVATKNIEE